MGYVEKKIRGIVEGSGCGAIMAFGPDNFRYLTGALLPFAQSYPERNAVAVVPEEGKSFVVAPVDWVEAVRDQGLKGEAIAYDENEAPPPRAFVKALARELEGRGLSGSRLGFDASRASGGLLMAVKEVVPSTSFVPVDEKLWEARMIKAPEEVALIEKASLIADRGIIHALNHLEGTLEGPGYTIPEFTERTRVHIFESGGSGVGLLATAFGTEAQFVYTPQRGSFAKGEIFGIDVSSHCSGYWTSLRRMCFTGPPPPEYCSAYADNIALKSAAEGLLEPGARCDEVYMKVLDEALREDIPLCADSEIGHGVGVSHYEAPYLRLGYSRALESGMVIALDIQTYGPRKEIISSKDVYEVVGGGCRKLSWYKNWNTLYEVIGFRAAH